MKLLTFSVESKARPGALKDDRVIDLAAAGLPAGPNGGLIEIARGGDAMLDRARKALADAKAKSYALSEVKVLPPIRRPSKIIAVGLNYIDHCKEANLPVPAEPVLFSKFTTSICGPYDDLTWPASVTKEVDYEVEMGVVIGKQARDVPEKDALDYVLGYTVVNDVSARDLQFAGAKQWDRGKSLDTFCPWGPYIVTRDEIPDPHVLQVRTILNGREMQNSNTRNLIFNVNKIIAYASQGTTLLPGDLIPTGTPFGVGFSRKPPVFLKDGDVCECEVEKIGAIRNRIRLGR
ncbi:MAG: fumarylacetoacetate hydrolase family protein [Betaproteobacteria bacterium]|nr:fumarylacetoacetate hydrolase family protein [Betaproteobacteria bacterium]